MTIPTPATNPAPGGPLSDAQLIAAERQALLETLREAGPHAPTLCEGWETRHLAAHLLLRESSLTYAAGVMGGPLGERTERLTQEKAAELTSAGSYDAALFEFAKLPGHLHLRSRKPAADAAMNLVEYFVHIEDVRRAVPSWEPRELPAGMQQKLWTALGKQARLMAGRKFADGLVLSAPGYSPAAVTVVRPKPGKVATILAGEPGELLFYLFGRDQARVEVS